MGFLQLIGVKQKNLSLEQVKREEIKLGIRENQTLSKLEKIEKEREDIFAKGMKIKAPSRRRQLARLYDAKSAGVKNMERELALIKVRATAEERPKVLQIVEVFRARVVDVTPDALMVEITGTEDKIEGLLDVLRPFGIIEMARTGTVAMRRGSEAVTVDPGFVHARLPNSSGEERAHPATG